MSPLSCPVDLSGVDLGFEEFIDCTTLSINYNELGLATLSFTVVATAAQPLNPSIYTDLTFGRVRFTGYVTSLDVRRISGTTVYEHKYALNAIGCRV